MNRFFLQMASLVSAASLAFAAPPARDVT